MPTGEEVQSGLPAAAEWKGNFQESPSTGVRSSGGVSADCRGGPVRLGAAGVLEFGVDASGLGELVFEDDDAARGIECGALVDQFTGAGGET